MPSIANQRRALGLTALPVEYSAREAKAGPEILPGGGWTMQNPQAATANILIATVTPVETRAAPQAFKQATGKDAQALPIEGRVCRGLGEIHGAKVFLAW